MAAAQQQRVLALAAVFQALGEVRAVAEHGRCDRDRVRTCLRGLFEPYAGDVAAVYGGLESLDAGLKQLITHLSEPTAAHLTRYLVSVLQLERRLRRDRSRLSALTEGLEKVRRQSAYFGDIQHDNVISGLAEVYAGQISSLRPRIMVQGHARYLEDERNAALIRALLLAAIRAAGLWQAQGGGRLALVFSRRGLIETAQALRSEH